MCTLCPALIRIFSKQVFVPTDEHRGWTALWFLSAFANIPFLRMLPHIIPLCRSPQTSVTHSWAGLCSPCCTNLVPWDKTGSATLLKDVDTWHTSAAPPGINIKVRKICILTLLYIQLHFISIFQLAKSVRCDVTCLCVSTGAAWDAISHLKCLHRASGRRNDWLGTCTPQKSQPGARWDTLVSQMTAGTHTEVTKTHPEWVKCRSSTCKQISCAPIPCTVRKLQPGN